MVNMDKITRTKLAMLVTAVLLTIFTTIGLYYTMTVSNIINVETGGDPLLLNLSMVFAIMIAFMWVVVLIMFYEFKTDDTLKTEINKLERHVVELEEYKQTLIATAFPPATFDADVLKEGGVSGHIPSQ
jgi:hypothetical protein